MSHEESGNPQDLRRLLLNAAREILSEPDTSLDLRKVAERAGKSRTAPYLAFGRTEDGGGLAALRLAVAGEGFRELVGRMGRALASTEDPEEGLFRLSTAYLEFARENGRLFRLMFGAEVAQDMARLARVAAGHRELTELRHARREAERTILAAVERQTGGYLRAERVLGSSALSAALWAMLHGVTMLTIDEQWSAMALGESGTPDELARFALRFLTTGTTKEVQQAALALAEALREREGAFPSDRVLGSMRESPAAYSGTKSVVEADGLVAYGRPDPSVRREREASARPAHDAIRTSTALQRARRVLDRIAGTRVLWVDDRPELSRPEQRVLEGLSVRVSRARDTEEALELLGRERFDVILSDIERDGVQDAGVRALPELHARAPETPVIFYVGEVRKPNVAPSGSFGVTSDPEELLHLVLDALERRWT